MYLKDFIYDDDKLSSSGCIIGSLDSSNNEDSQMSKVSFETVINNGTYINELINAKYEDVISFSFDIFKNPCINGNYSFFTDNEISYFTKWLCRKEYHKFIPIYDDFSYYSTYYIGSFTEISSISQQGGVIGLSLTFTTNAPFGFTKVGTIKSNSIAKTIGGNTVYQVDVKNNSDEIGILYPDKIKLTLKATPPGGDSKLIFRNETENINRETTIRNCTSGETITFDCVHKILTSDIETHKLYNDFNYNFPRLISTIKSGKNILSSNVPFYIEIDYTPIKKVGVVV